MATPSPSLIHVDEALLVVNKPAGLPSVSLKENESGTLAAWILGRYPEQASLPHGEREAGLVQRLDNDTSGVIVAARTPAAREDLLRQMENGTMIKTYMALVLGHPPPAGEVLAPIAHHPKKKNKMLVCSSPTLAREHKARPATTVFSVEERFHHPRSRTPYALVRVILRTGLRHQVRVHLASLGFPLSGDLLYQNAKWRTDDTLAPDRHLLHAARVTLAHPVSAVTLSFDAPLPKDLLAALGRLRPAA